MSNERTTSERENMLKQNREFQKQITLIKASSTLLSSIIDLRKHSISIDAMLSGETNKQFNKLADLEGKLTTFITRHIDEQLRDMNSSRFSIHVMDNNEWVQIVSETSIKFSEAKKLCDVISETTSVPVKLIDCFGNLAYSLLSSTDRRITAPKEVVSKEIYEKEEITLPTKTYMLQNYIDSRKNWRTAERCGESDLERLQTVFNNRKTMAGSSMRIVDNEGNVIDQYDPPPTTPKFNMQVLKDSHWVHIGNFLTFDSARNEMPVKEKEHPGFPIRVLNKDTGQVVLSSANSHTTEDDKVSKPTKSPTW